MRRKVKYVRRKVNRKFEVAVGKAEANGWRFYVQAVTSDKTLRPIIHTKWFRTQREAIKEKNRFLRRIRG